MNESSCNIINTSFFDRCKNFVQYALKFLEPNIGVSNFILRHRPETQRERIYRLQNPQPDFYVLIFKYERNLKASQEFSDFDRIMHKDPILSKHVDTMVSSGTSGVYADSSLYIFFILNEMLARYYVSGNEFDEVLFNSLYCDLEYLFYNDGIPFKVIAPLLHFGSKLDAIELNEGLTIRKISEEERKTFPRLAKGLDLTWIQMEDFEYAIEYNYVQKKSIGDSARISINDTVVNLLNRLVSVMRLFGEGSLGFVSTIWKPMLRTGIMGGGMFSSFPPEITYGRKYELDEGKASSFQTFWHMEKWNMLETTENKNLNLALRRFNSAYTRRSNDDKLIDYAIAYEALFSKSSKDGDSLTHKLALRFSRLVENDFEKRKEYFAAMKTLYGKRSRVVHGDPTPVASATVEEIGRHMRKAINAYLDQFNNNSRHEDIIDRLDLG